MDSTLTRKTTQSDLYRIEIDGKWLVKDFSDFFHLYNEVYSLYFLLGVAESSEDRVKGALARYLWRGGYSVVNFYDDLFIYLGEENRPEVSSIQYASPGYIELSIAVAVAMNIRRIVEQFTRAGHAINDLYHSVYKDLQARKLLSLDVRGRELELSKKEAEFVSSMYSQFSQALAVPQPDAFLKASPNTIAALKVLLSLCRRNQKLSQFEAQRKIKL